MKDRKRDEDDDTTTKSNAGSVSVNTDGGMSVGIGGRLAIDTSDGSLGIHVGGVTIDLG